MRFYDQIRALESKLIREALKKYHTVTRAAHNLGIERSTLHQKIKALDIIYTRCTCDDCKGAISEQARQRSLKRAENL